MVSDLSRRLETINEQITRNGRSVYDFLTQSKEAQQGTFLTPPSRIKVTGSFDKSCILSLGAGAVETIESGRGQLRLGTMMPGKTVTDCFVHIGNFSGRIELLFGSSASVVVGELGVVRIDGRLGHRGVLVIGDKTTINNARLIAVNCNILVGKDGLWSDEILAQGFDQHGLVDVATREIINLHRRDIVLGEHVWIGRRSTLMPSVTIGEGSIIGAGAMVTKSVPAFTAAAGNPARVLRENVSWARPWSQIDPDTAAFLDARTGNNSIHIEN